MRALFSWTLFSLDTHRATTAWPGPEAIASSSWQRHRSGAVAGVPRQPCASPHRHSRGEIAVSAPPPSRSSASEVTVGRRTRADAGGYIIPTSCEKSHNYYIVRCRTLQGPENAISEVSPSRPRTLGRRHRHRPARHHDLAMHRNRDVLRPDSAHVTWISFVRDPNPYDTMPFASTAEGACHDGRRRVDSPGLPCQHFPATVPESTWRFTAT
jgi:hypothetical protein